jgi:hypothetical protein
VNPPPGVSDSVTVPELPCVTFSVIAELVTVTAAATVSVTAGLAEFAYAPPAPDV